MQQDAAVERVGTRRIQGFLRQFIVQWTPKDDLAALKISGEFHASTKC